MTALILTFPHDLKVEAIEAVLAAISGTAQTNWLGMPTSTRLAFELVATDRQLWHRLKVPSAIADYVAVQLRTLIPGCRVEPARRQATVSIGIGGWPVWDYAVELGVTGMTRSLRTPVPEALAATILASVQLLKRGEAVLLQLVIMPIPSAPPPTPGTSLVSERRGIRGRAGRILAQPGCLDVRDQINKLSEPNLLGVLRIAARTRGRDGLPAADTRRARQLVTRVRHAIASANGPHSHWRRRSVSQAVVHRRVVEAAGLFLYPLHVSASELAGLLAWPLGPPHVAGLPAARPRQLPATEVIPRRGGKVVADSNFPGASRPLVLTPREACKHLHVVGGTGVGKTTLLANLMAQDMAAGHGVISLESKGDLFRSALDLVPAHRVDDVIVLDITDTACPLGFNVLADGSRRSAVERICALFERLYHDTRGVWSRELLFHGLSTLTMDPRYTFVDLPALFLPLTDTEEAWRDELISSVRDKELQAFWRRFMDLNESARERMAQPVLDRVWQLNARPEIRNVIGQSVSSFDMPEVVRTGKVLLVNLAGLPEATASLAGTLIFNSIWSAVQTVASDGGLARPCLLYLDEFQSFLNLPISPEEMLAKARSYGLGLTLAHQHLSQLPTELRSAVIHQHLGQLGQPLRAAVLANARSRISFRPAQRDGTALAATLGGGLTAADLERLAAYQAIARLLVANTPSHPFAIQTLPLPDPTNDVDALRAASQRRYGVDGVEIDQALTARWQGGDATTDAPIGVSRRSS